MQEVSARKRFIRALLELGLIMAPALVVSLGTAPSARADIGLMVYDALSPDPYLEGSGHSGVYLNDVCMTEVPNQFRVCTTDDKSNGNTGTVIQRYSGMTSDATKNDWIALPLNVNLYGKEGGKSDAPIVSTPQIRNLLTNEAYSNDDLHLNQLMKPIQGKKETAPPVIPDGNWQYAIGMTAIRSAHLVSVSSTTVQDQRVVDFLNNDQNISHFSKLFNNCASLANNIFKVANGAEPSLDKNGNLKIGKSPDFNGQAGFEDAFLVTPMSDAKAVRKLAKKENIPYTVTTFVQNPGTFKVSKGPTEITSGSNSQIAVNLALHFVPNAGLINLGLKQYRKHGGIIPGLYKPYFDLEGKEVREHGTPELAEDTYDLAQMKKRGAPKSDVKALKNEIHTLQNETFGSPQCWKAQEKKLGSVVTKAVQAGIVTPEEQKLFRIHDTRNMLMRMIPFMQFNPTQSPLIRMIAAETKVTDSPTDGLLLSKSGVTAGLSRNNVEKHDQALGFLLVAAAVDYDLGAQRQRRPETADFDADWAMMISLGKNAGLSIDPGEEGGVRTCVDAALRTPIEPVPCNTQNETVPGDGTLPVLDQAADAASLAAGLQ